MSKTYRGEDVLLSLIKSYLNLLPKTKGIN